MGKGLLVNLSLGHCGRTYCVTADFLTSIYLEKAMSVDVLCSLNYFKSWRFSVCMWVDLCVWMCAGVCVDVCACRQGWPGEGEGGDGPHREATRLHLLHGRAPGHRRRVRLPQGSCPLLPRYQPPVVVFLGGGG